MATFSRLVRFVPAGSGNASTPQIGEPVDASLDVGLQKENTVEVNVYSGSSVLSPGQKTGQTALAQRILSPLSAQEVGSIRCIGLNYYRHAEEVKLPVPQVPVLFLKPETSLNDPAPATVVIPKAFVRDEAADYESELAIVIGKDCKDVSEEQAMDYLLGYTAANDISSRLAQFAQSQWCYSKGFDGACPIGPAIIHRDQVKDIKQLRVTGSHNGEVVQDSTMDDLIFSIPKIISFLSQGTTLKAGTIILTGTPPGVGWSSSPRRVLRDGDEFTVAVSHGVGTLVSRIVAEK
ncbi:unnamed protein product [Jaminaea pallidilutea]